MKNKVNRCRKGIILAGGSGTRLYPMTAVTNKQLLPIYDKPTIYYPLTTLMLAGINDILIICNPGDQKALELCLQDGSQWNISIQYAIQEAPNGLAEAFLIGESFIHNQPVALILGDNFYYGHGFSGLLEKTAQDVNGCHLLAYVVRDPRRYGVVVLDEHGQAKSIIEKPTEPLSRYAVTGLYFYDQQVVDYAKQLKPSARGELEITDLNNLYLQNNQVSVNVLGRGFVWFDVGTPESLAKASQYVQVVQERQAIGIACPEEVAWRMKYISDQAFYELCKQLPDNNYRQYLMSLLEEDMYVVQSHPDFSQPALKYKGGHG